MKSTLNTYTISHKATIKDALEQLNISLGNTLFVIDDDKKVLRTLTDGDIRRGLLDGATLTTNILEVAFKDFKYIQQNRTTKKELQSFKDRGIEQIPILNQEFQLIRIIDLSETNAILPLDCVIMAGGKGTRLLPLTKDTPKPLLKVGDKPILEYNVDRLARFGIKNLHITINYLGDQISDYFKDGQDKGIHIDYVQEDQPLGTIGALKLVENFQEDYILLMNSDLLTNIDFGDLFNDFLLKEGDMIIATIPYKVAIPYGVVETEDNYVTQLKEKPTYTYYSNAGIYILKKDCLKYVPENEFFNATDLVEVLLKEGRKVINYPILNYWLDIGKHEDFKKAQEDIKHIKL